MVMNTYLSSNVTQGKVTNAAVLSVLQAPIRPIKRSCSKGELKNKQEPKKCNIPRDQH